jgi:GNAT superfamily N-acetyltransferase
MVPSRRSPAADPSPAVNIRPISERAIFAPLALGDGSIVSVRQLTAADRPELARGIERLSDDSRYMRFLTPFVPSRTVEQLTMVDHRHREALLAFDPGTGDGVAVARYSELPEQAGAVEVAVTVEDEWQGRGIGSALLQRILVRAADTGHVKACALVLAENRRSLHMLERAGFLRATSSGSTVELERTLC